MENQVKQIFERGLGDSMVRSIIWTENDLIIDLALPGQSGTAEVLSLRFKNIASLRVEMNYGGYVGRPLLFSADAMEVSSGWWAVRFEFGAAPDGSISFECGEISKV